MSTLLGITGGALYPATIQAASAAPVHRMTLMATDDTMVSAAATGTNFGAHQRLLLGTTKADQWRALLRFDMSSLPPDATLVGATLQLHQTAASDKQTALAVRVDAAGRAWREQQVTWNAQPQAVQRDEHVTVLNASAGWKAWNVTALARGWAANPTANMGVVLQPLTADAPTTRTFTSRDAADALQAPRLVVEYQFQHATLTVNNLPVSLQRRATQFLEEMRTTAMAPGWANAYLGSSVQSVHRPDLTTVAYYEVPVVAPGRNGTQQTMGYIMLSAGEHDQPIVQWNARGETPTQELQRLAAAGRSTIQRFYKLDTLAYTAEDSAGNLIAKPGTLPPEIVGQQSAWITKTVELSESQWMPTNVTASDGETARLAGAGTLTRTGPQGATPYQTRAWSSWQALKTGYARSYATQLLALKQRASADWGTEAQAQRTGEGLERGEVYRLALLSSTAPQVQVEGAGARMITTALQTAGTRPAVFQITVNTALATTDVPFTVVVTYATGRVERIPFVIVSDAAIAKARQEQAAQESGATDTVRSQNEVAATAGAWSPWTYYFAGSDADQRLYSQIPAGSPPNTSSCWSGCGATAWAMLFGWADNQAAQGNPYWAKRWGLYRENGGYGANVVAPRFMDTGVRNMTWELRQRSGTFCAFGDGATHPSTMDGAAGYLSGRSGAKLFTSYNSFGIAEGRLMKHARRQIRDHGTPAVIGTGWLKHYPLADAYAHRERKKKVCVPLLGCVWSYTEHQRQFFANQGQGGANNGWIEASTWFAGRIYP